MEISQKLKNLINILSTLNAYNIDGFPSFRRSIESFEFDKIYEALLCFLDENDVALNKLSIVLNEITEQDFDTMYRIKAEESLRLKWRKNLGKNKQLREVCNDIIGIRVITDIDKDEISNIITKTADELGYKIDIVNLYSKPKSIDDGYRALHVYIKNNPKGFPIEIQFWSRKDALLNFYTHEVIYKNLLGAPGESYSLSLRNWLDSIPVMPNAIQKSFIDYLYEIVYAQSGGE